MEKIDDIFDYENQIISYEEYSQSLDSVDYSDLVELMKNRLKINKNEIYKIINNHFNFKSTIKKNYKNFINSISIYKVDESTKNNMYQPSLF